MYGTFYGCVCLCYTQGVLTRGRQGNASSDEALKYESLIVPMAEAGLHYAASSHKISKVAPFHLSPKAQKVLEGVTSFIDERIIPAEKVQVNYSCADNHPVSAC